MSTASNSTLNQSALVLASATTILFGFAAVFWPSLTMLVLLYLFSSLVLVGGMVNVLTGLGRTADNDASFLSVLLGFFEIGVGVYLLRHTSVSLTTMILLIGLVLVARGIVEEAISYFDKSLTAKLQMINYLVGLVSMAAGLVVLFAKPAHGIAFVWVLGVYAFIVGTTKVYELAHSSKW